MGGSALPDNLMQQASSFGGNFIQQHNTNETSRTNYNVKGAEDCSREDVLMSPPRHVNQSLYDPINSQDHSFTAGVGNLDLDTNLPVGPGSDCSGETEYDASSQDDSSQRASPSDHHTSPEALEWAIPQTGNPTHDTWMRSGHGSTEHHASNQYEDASKDDSDLAKFERLSQALKDSNIMQEVGAKSLEDIETIIKVGLQKSLKPKASTCDQSPEHQNEGTPPDLVRRPPSKIKCNTCGKEKASQSDLKYATTSFLSHPHPVASYLTCLPRN